MASSSWRLDGHYTLLPNYSGSFTGVPWLAAWYGNAKPNRPCAGASSGGLPFVAIDRSMSPASSACGVIDPGQVAVAPAAGRDAIIAWRSPISGRVRLSGSLTSLTPGGNGVIWYIASGTTTLAHGYLPSGGTRDLNVRVAVTTGQNLYLIIAPRNSDDRSDLTGVDLSVTQGPAVDQSFGPPSDLSSAINDCCRYIAQTFTAGMTGKLAGINVSISSYGSAPLHVAIRNVEPSGAPGTTILGEVTLVSNDAPLSRMIVFPQPIPIVAGQRYAIVVDYPTASQPPGDTQGEWGSATGNRYTGGSGYASQLDGITWSGGNQGYDLFFRTYVWPNS